MIRFRTIDPGEREDVLDLLAEWDGESRAHFARYFAYDPTYRDDLCFVAADEGRLVATLQVFRKHVRLGSAVLDVAGVANVFTAESYRARGVSTQLLENALAAMSACRFDASLLFATRLGFYGRMGWISVPRQWVFVQPGISPAPEPYAIGSFSNEDLDAVCGLYDQFCAGRSGTTVRDRNYWTGQLRTAGNLDEDFLLARRAGEVVAYVRATRLYGLYVTLEHAHAPGQAAALVALLRHLLNGAASGEVGVATQLRADPEVLAALEAAGHPFRAVDDVFWMWRVIDAASIAAKLGVSADEVRRPDFFARQLPPESSVYWLADRF